MEQRSKGAGGAVDVGDALTGDEFSQVLRVVAFAWEVELAAADEGGVEVFLGEVEAAGADDEAAVAGFEVEGAQVPVHEMAEAALVDLRAFGLAGAAGGVDDIEQVVGAGVRNVRNVRRGGGLLRQCA